LRYLIASVNAIRRSNPALQNDATLHFEAIANDQLVAYTKATADLGNVLLIILNIDPHYRQSGFVEVDLPRLGIDPRRPYEVHDLLTDARYTWTGPRNYVQLEPGIAHIFAVTQAPAPATA